MIERGRGSETGRVLEEHKNNKNNSSNKSYVTGEYDDVEESEVKVIRNIKGTLAYSITYPIFSMGMKISYSICQ